MLSILTTAIDVVNKDNNENPPCDAEDLFCRANHSVKAVLAEHRQWMKTLPHSAGAAALADESALRTDALVGPYRLLREIGGR